MRKGGRDTQQSEPLKAQVTFPALLQSLRTHHSTAAVLGANGVM